MTIPAWPVFDEDTVSFHEKSRRFVRGRKDPSSGVDAVECHKMPSGTACKNRTRCS